GHQVVPGRRRIFMLQVPLTPFIKSLGHLVEQFPRAFVAVGRRLAQKTMRLLEAPVLERFLCLPECQPCETDHQFFRSQKSVVSNQSVLFYPGVSLLSLATDYGQFEKTRRCSACSSRLATPSGRFFPVHLRVSSTRHLGLVSRSQELS